MDQTVVVKTEMQSNSEILLFYVDENGGNEEGVLTTVENIENQAIELQKDGAFIIPDDTSVLNGNLNLPHSSSSNANWTHDEIKRLLVFYNDNKQIFIMGTTQKKHLWTVACKTMLVGKHPNSCEKQLNSLRNTYFKYMETHIQKGLYVEWPYFALCHQVFNDEMDNTPADSSTPSEPQLVNTPASNSNHDDTMAARKVNNRTSGDVKVELMLNLYLKYKKNFQQDYKRKGLWETIAIEIGEDNGEYWQKRFLNYKQHYLQLLEKRSKGNETINWPYMDLFDKIFEGDKVFKKKYVNQEDTFNKKIEKSEDPTLDWNSTEMTVLVKYYYDCFEEFEDRTIPNNFLWNEIGRLLDKKAELCKQKYEEMKNAHLHKYIEGCYEFRNRKPIEILYDNIISKEIELQIIKLRDKPEESVVWKTELLDELVQFFYDNIEMYKDTICHYVCWAAVVQKLKQDLQCCKGQWDDLVELYKTILNDKKENPDMQIDWRYIELFDRIFDYGMDINEMIGYDKLSMAWPNKDLEKVDDKRIKKENVTEYISDDESFDERGFTKRTKLRSGDSKAFKILEYYQKNKDKFSTTNRNKHSLWEVLAKQIGISATQCAHRFRNLKQVYTAYVQREINKPEMPIVWPYYVLCKKVFGYRAIKTKLKNGKSDSDDTEEWSAKEIKLLINYFSKNFHDISNNVDDTSKWADLSKDTGKSVTSCKEKFLELRKSYRKLKTMRTRNPDVRISWKYFNMFEQIYEAIENNGVETLNMDQDDEYQCIIVMPEGEENDAIQIIDEEMETPQTMDEEISYVEEMDTVPNPTEIEAIKQKCPVKWTKRNQKLLIIYYINYIRLHKGKKIKPKEMWAEIGVKLNKTPVSCKRVFMKMKENHSLITDENLAKESFCYKLLEKVKLLKPKFVKSKQSNIMKTDKIYKDVVLPDEKVIKALLYYLEHIEDFVSPRYEKKYLWTELATHVGESVTKVYNKINHLKQVYNSDSDVIDSQNTTIEDLLKEIIAKEIAIRLIIDNNPKPSLDDSDKEETWTDEETEQLLEWYLSNLEKFKNPKFVRSYLWMEVSILLNKNAVACSKKMSEIRTQYRNKVRESTDELTTWRFLELCQKIYGTGKKISQVSGSSVIPGQLDVPEVP